MCNTEIIFITRNTGALVNNKVPRDIAELIAGREVMITEGRTWATVTPFRGIIVQIEAKKLKGQVTEKRPPRRRPRIRNAQ